jgi:hypothetical protein
MIARTSSNPGSKDSYSYRLSSARSLELTFADHLQTALQIGLRREIMGKHYLILTFDLFL